MRSNTVFDEPGALFPSNVDMTNRSLGNGASFSGNERDSVYLNKGGKDFVNISGITGLDDPGDGRSMAILDYDRDGWPDIVVVNATAPAMQLYRNQMGDGASAGVRKNKMLAVRFVGGNHSGSPSKEWSNRDGYGALLTAEMDGMTIVREHRAGEGMGAQNSAAMLIGIGEQSSVKALSVRWPSGKIQSIGEMPANTLLTVYENPAHSPTGSAVLVKPYKVESIRPPKQRDAALR